jgi:DNA-binding transcriptional ArsR family regulator
MEAETVALDQVFSALSDSTRREIIQRLKQGPATVSELAAPYAMSLPGFMKHLRVLEEAGLLSRVKEGRSVHCELAPQALEDAAMWLSRYQEFWNRRLDALGRYLYHQEEVHPWPPTSPEPQAHSKTAPGSASSAAILSPPKKSGGRGRTRKR